VSKLLTVSVMVLLSVFVQAQAIQYARGDVVRLKSQANGDPLPDSRIIAVAGDHIQFSKSGVLVNDQVVPDLSKRLLAQLTAEPWEQVVPAGHYVVVGERQDATGTVTYHGLIPGSNILGSVNRQ
jgi:signal peptidase I